MYLEQVNQKKLLQSILSIQAAAASFQWKSIVHVQSSQTGSEQIRIQDNTLPNKN